MSTLVIDLKLSRKLVKALSDKFSSVMIIKKKLLLLAKSSEVRKDSTNKDSLRKEYLKFFKITTQRIKRIL